MFYAKANNTADGSASVAARARDAGVAAAKAAAASSVAQTAAAAAQSAAQAAAQGVNSAAQTAATGVSQGTKQGVYSARVWAAPRLESAADYVTATAAPAVSSALRSTAQQVRPPAPRRRRSGLTWSLLGAAIVAALGAVGAIIWQRYQAAMAADTEVDEAEETTTSGDAGKTDSAPAAGTGTDTGVNGRVSADRW